MDAFTQAYITAMFFTEEGPNNLGDAGMPEISTKLMEQITQDCTDFQSQAGDLISSDNCSYTGCSSIEYAGHDFWLTRNGHGCGFWSGNWKEPAATKLTNIAELFGEMDVYIGDDGKIYC